MVQSLNPLLTMPTITTMSYYARFQMERYLGKEPQTRLIHLVLRSGICPSCKRQGNRREFEQTLGLWRKSLEQSILVHDLINYYYFLSPQIIVHVNVIPCQVALFHFTTCFDDVLPHNEDEGVMATVFVGPEFRLANISSHPR